MADKRNYLKCKAWVDGNLKDVYVRPKRKSLSILPVYAQYYENGKIVVGKVDQDGDGKMYFLPKTKEIFPITEDELPNGLKELSITEQVTNLLNDLNEKPDIAKYLMENNIKGCKTSSINCPIANYLNSRVKTFMCVTVTCMYTSLYDENTYIDNPPNVTAFIRSFNSGMYPELIG